jgi:very-short-patch-repair endonuclease
MSIELARKLRKISSPPERAMWNILRQLRQQGHHFRRQVQLGPYYVDYANLEEAMVIEVDGATHTTDEAIEADAVRDAYLRSRGFEVLRFSNSDVVHNPAGVFDVMVLTLARLATPTLDPSPHGGGRRRSRTNPLETRIRRPRQPRRPDPQKAMSPSPMRGGVRGGGDSSP